MAENTGTALGHLSRASEVLAHVRGKHLRREAEKSARTSKLALQDKRIALAEQAKFIEKIQNVLAAHYAAPSEKPCDLVSESEIAEWEAAQKKREVECEKLANMANIAGMSGYLEGLGLIVDCLTEQQDCNVQKKDGNIVPGKRRISISDDLARVHDMLVDLVKMVEALTDINHDLLRRAVGFGSDEHGVEDKRSPYEIFGNADEKIEVPLVAEGTADVVTDEEEARRLEEAAKRAEGDRDGR